MDTHFDVESKQPTVYNIHKVYVRNHSLQHASKKRNTLRHITKIPLVTSENLIKFESQLLEKYCITDLQRHQNRKD